MASRFHFIQTMTITRPQIARATLLLAAALSAATPVLAQTAALDAAATGATTAPLQAALAQNGTPLQLPSSAFDGSWRRFRAAFTGDRYNSFSDVELVTRGETIAVGTQTFLVTYRAPDNRQRSQAVSQAARRAFSAQPEATNSTDFPDAGNATDDATGSADIFVTADGYGRLFSDENLRLTLVNTAIVGAMTDVRAFDARLDVIDNSALNAPQRVQAREQAAGQISTSNLKQIGLALIQYTQDWDEKYPPMRSAQSMAQIKRESALPYDAPGLRTAQQALYPYIKNTDVFAHPTTRQLYRPNLNLSGRSMATIEDLSKTVAFYEASPASDGTRAVAYADGHVKRERETDWAAIRALSDRLVPPLDFGKGKRAVSMGNPTGATVTLHDAAALAYMFRRGRDNLNRPQTVYVSDSTGRIYYRDAQTHQAIWLSSPEGRPAPEGVTVAYEQAQEFRDLKGYNGQTSGGDFDPRELSSTTFRPKVKTALGANSAMKGSIINVDTLGDGTTIVLRGRTTSQAQKTLAAAIAKKNAPGFRIENQLQVQGN